LLASQFSFQSLKILEDLALAAEQERFRCFSDSPVQLLVWAAVPPQGLDEHFDMVIGAGSRVGHDQVDRVFRLGILDMDRVAQPLDAGLSGFFGEYPVDVPLGDAQIIPAA
jgi:hypothetical protein